MILVRRRSASQIRFFLIYALLCYLCKVDPASCALDFVTITPQACSTIFCYFFFPGCSALRYPTLDTLYIGEGERRGRLNDPSNPVFEINKGRDTTECRLTPSTRSISPETYWLAVLARNTTGPAKSLGSPHLPAGIRSEIWRWRVGSAISFSFLFDNRTVVPSAHQRTIRQCTF